MTSAVIRQIDQGTVRRICAGQVVVDVSSTLKELVENSLDAGATRVEARLTSHGLGALEVSDDGGGIPTENHDSVALPHWTSKLTSFTELQGVATFGFRGEALASVCQNSSGLCVTTRHRGGGDGGHGYSLTYSEDGSLKESVPVQRSFGTTVRVTGLFSRLPVRLLELRKGEKRELSKAVGMMTQYAVCSEGVSFRLEHEGKVLLSSSASKSLRDRVGVVFGSEFARSLEDVNLARSVTEPDGEVRVSGLVSGPSVGRSSSDRQMFFLNGRPVDLPRVVRAANALWKAAPGATAHKCPALFLNVTVPQGRFDVNVTPDKRTVMLHDEAELIEVLSERLQTLWNTQDCEVGEVDPSPLQRKRRKTFAELEDHVESLPGTPQKRLRATDGCLPTSPLRLETTLSGPIEEARTASGTHVFVAADSKRNDVMPHLGVELVARISPDDILARFTRECSAPRPRAGRPALACHGEHTCDAGGDPCSSYGRKLGVDVDDQCEGELVRKFDKSQFASLRVVGQFNLGFIVALLPGTRDLFIIDQHAADEIKNFEELQRATSMHFQPLIAPITLDLSAEDELVVMESLPLIEEHGFRLQVDDSSPVGKRVKLHSCVLSHGRTFGANDVYELVALIKDTPTSVGSLSRVRAMFASRACRMSVMIGTPLDADHLSRIVKKLGTLENPWRCPHGRPTMRHLVRLRDVHGDDPEDP